MTTMTTNRLVWTLALALGLAAFAAPRAAHAIGEQNGRVSGTVTEAQTGAPVPGATVTASSPSLIGPPRNVTTGEDGRYEIVELPPGKYTVEVSYSGVKPITRKVVVRQGEMLPLDIAWSAELAETEVTVVVEERHMTRPDSTQSGTVISADSEAKIASGRSYQDVALQVAGTADVGQASGNPLVKGGTWLNNHWLVDGLDISDPVLSSFSANINFDSIASVEMITGGMEAQYNSLGGVINLITNAGSDEWHVDSSLYVSNSKFSATGQYGPQLYNGISDFARLRPGSNQSYQANVNVGGPIVKHRLWFNASVEYDYTERSTTAGPPLNLQPPPRKFNGVLARLKLTWAPNEKHRITLSMSSDPAFISNVDSGTAANSELAVAQNYQRQGGIFAIVQWDYFISQNMNFNLQTGTQWQFLDAGPEGFFATPDCQGTDTMFGPNSQCKNYNRNRPGHQNQEDGTNWWNGGPWQNNGRYSFQFDPSLSLRGRLAGYHDAKFGIQTRYVRSEFAAGYPGGQQFLDAGGGPGEAGLCPTDDMGNVMPGASTAGCSLVIKQADYKQVQWGFNVGAYVQDRWKPIKRLTILPGLRFDYGFTKNSLGQTVTSLWGFGPRLGATFDITGDQKTIVSAFYGRSNETLSLIPAGDAADITSLGTVSLFNPATNKFDIPITAFGGAGGYKIDPNPTTPHADEVTLSIRREVFRDSVAGIEYTYKRLSNIWDGVEINQIWDPAGFRVTGFVDPTHPQQIYKVTTPDKNYREYQGIDFTVESRPTPNWDIYGAYTLAWTYGPGGEQFGQVNFDQSYSPFKNPRLTHFYDGFLLEDVRHQIKLRASYTYRGFTAGTFIQYVSGSPLTKKFYNFTSGGFDNQRSPSGTDPGTNTNDPRRFSEFRVPDLFSVDLRASYDFHELIKQHVILIVDFFNLFNLNAATSIQNLDVSSFGSVGGRQTPFHFQLALRYVY
jgi:Carboxypeptidase regulatory-like domain/TonB dependent receptor-like, beta-barrel